MKLRNYCIIVMGNTIDVLKEIQSVADSQPNTLNAVGIMIATFASFAEPPELTDFFKERQRDFVLFDLNTQNSGFNFLKDNIQQGLFGFLNEHTDEELRDRTADLVKELTSSTVADGTSTAPEETTKTKISLEDIDKMSQKDKDELLDKLIDKGQEKLSNYEKKILKKLALS